MAYLLDTGILLRLVNAADLQHATIRAALGRLGAANEPLYISTQNVCEFCNVVTRPVANNGLGRSTSDAILALKRDIEPICSVLVETDVVYGELTRLIGRYAVAGKQVHDARLVAMMIAWQVENILTLNESDFRRYAAEGINAVTPGQLIAP